MNEEAKNVDKNWEEQVDKEKQKALEKGEAYHQPTFTVFLSSLSIQAMIAAGKIDNPLSGKKEVSLEQTRFLIDTLQIIKDKTINNLTTQEETLLNDYLFNLRMIYVEAKKNSSSNG
ncbi:MAG: DUF1844 domain-containing protein [Candidatus Omnitrophota bacterium]